MNRLREIANRAPILIFFALAFVFTWSLLPFTTMSIVVSLVALCGPAVAACVVSLIRGEWSEFRGRLTDWRVSPVWYVLAVLVPVAISALRSGIELLLGASGTIEPQPIDILSIVVFVLVLGEEAGWRGYVLPHLRPRFGMWWSSVIIGVVWAVWHLPLFYMSNMPQFGSPFLAFIFYTIALSVILTLFALKTRMSVVIATLFHGAVNTFGLVNTGADRTMRGWSNALSYGLVALAIALVWGYAARKRTRGR